MSGPVVTDTETILSLGGGGTEAIQIPYILYTTAGAITPFTLFDHDVFVRFFAIVSAASLGSAVLSTTQETLAQIFAVGGYKTQLIAYTRSPGAGAGPSVLPQLRLRIPANRQTWIVTEVSMAVMITVSD